MIASPENVCTTVEISLDGTGAYTGAHDDVTAAVAAEPGITIVEGREGARALGPPRIPSYSYALHNDDARYSPQNPGSLVYQLLFPGRPNRITLALGTARPWRSPTTWRNGGLWRGRRQFSVASGAVDDITQTTDFGNKRVGLTHLGTMSMLIGQNVTVGVQANIRTDQAIGLVLDAAGWPSGQRAISIGDTTMLYWWCDDKSPWTAILELLGAEGPCQLYQDADGVIHFENRNYRAVTPRSTTSQATFSETSATPLWYTNLTYEPGYKSIFNRATYATRRRALGALTPIWQYGATLTLSANQSVTLIAKPSDPFQNAVVPASGTDYTLSSGGLASVTLSATSGLVAFLTLTATAAGAVIVGVAPSAGIQLRAQPLTVVSETVLQNTVDASASIAKYSPVPGAAVPRTLTIQGWPEVDPVVATSVCNAWVLRYLEERPQVTLTLENADAAHVEQIFERQVSDRVTVQVSGAGITRDVWVETKETTIHAAGGRAIACLLGCEVVEVLLGAVWGSPPDTAHWDALDTVWGV